MKKVLLVGFVLFYGILGCTIKDNEIISLINSLKKQNDELLTQLGSVKKTTDSALVAVAKLNALQGATDAKIEAVKLDLQSVLAQIASLNVQITNNTGDVNALKAKVEALQLKCAELIAQITYLTKISQVYTLKVDISPTGSGAIQITPQADTYKYGTEVTLTVSSNTPYVFKQWTGDTTTSSNPLKFKITKNIKITAVLDNANALTVKDINGNIYNTVKIGTQVWMKENLNVTKYQNGDDIPYVPSSLWSAIKYGAWCYYDNDPGNGVKYGKLYNWYAAIDPRGLAPLGWHVSNIQDWTNLVTSLNATNGNVGSDLKAVTTDWQSPNVGATNFSGFTGLPGGLRSNNDGGAGFYKINQAGWWLMVGGSKPEFKGMVYENGGLNPINSTNYWNYFDVNTGASIRCVKD